MQESRSLETKGRDDVLREEFEIRTGIYLPIHLYQLIEKHYHATDADKDDFCRAYKENRDGLAERIQREAEKAVFEEEQSMKQKLGKMEEALKALEGKLKRKQEELDRELGWKPRGVLSQMSQESYEDLARTRDVRFLSEQEAKEWIEKECGFCSGQIRIVTQLYTYDVNKHYMFRRTGTVERKPVYFSTDWNYVRFDCGRWQYEIVNGELKLYCD